MTRIDFYIMGKPGQTIRDLFACQLAEKAFSQGSKIYIHLANENHAAQVDELLWTFDDNSFVPHQFSANPADCKETVVLGCGEALPVATDVLINLAEEIPPFFSQFERVAELIEGDQAQRDKGRDRYRFYRERGYQLQNHQL